MIIMNIQKIMRSRGRVSFIIRFRHHIHSIVKYFSMIASVLTFCYFWSKIPLNFSLNLTSQISECLHLPIILRGRNYDANHVHVNRKKYAAEFDERDAKGHFAHLDL